MISSFMGSAWVLVATWGKINASCLSVCETSLLCLLDWQAAVSGLFVTRAETAAPLSGSGVFGRSVRNRRLRLACLPVRQPTRGPVLLLRRLLFLWVSSDRTVTTVVHNSESITSLGPCDGPGGNPDISLRNSEFKLFPVHVGIIANKVVLGQVSAR